MFSIYPVWCREATWFNLGIVHIEHGCIDTTRIYNRDDRVVAGRSRVLIPQRYPRYLLMNFVSKVLAFSYYSELRNTSQGYPEHSTVIFRGS